MPAAVLARLILLQARRGALPRAACASVAGAVATGAFVSQLALAESNLFETAAMAAILRVCAVFVVSVEVVASVRREIDEKGLELMLSLPVSRATHYLGRLAGFACCAVLLAVVLALPLCLVVPGADLALWTMSLAFELTLVAAAALFFSMTLSGVLPALAATAGLYVLGRAIGAIQAIAAGPLATESSWQRLAKHAVDGVAILLPRLDTVTKTEWLLYGAPAPWTYGWLVGSLALYIALMAAAGLFDFHRRSS